MLSMVEKGIRGDICHSIYQHAKPNNKYMKDYDKKKESSYIQYWDVNNFYDWAMLQKLPVNNFEWIKDTSHFNENFIIPKKVMKDTFLKLMLDTLKSYMNLIIIYHFNLKGWKLKISKSLWLIYMLKLNVIHIKNLKHALNNGLVLK